MTIVKSEKLFLGPHSKAEPVLFVIQGSYFYVETGIVENGLRVLGNWQTAKLSNRNTIAIIEWNQGTEIPQELGDYLIANQDLAEKVLIVKRGDFTVESPYDSHIEDNAFEAGVIAGIFECGEILSRPLAHQNDNQTTNETEQTEDQTDN